MTEGKKKKKKMDYENAPTILKSIHIFVKFDFVQVIWYNTKMCEDIVAIYNAMHFNIVTTQPANMLSLSSFVSA